MPAAIVLRKSIPQWFAFIAAALFFVNGIITLIWYENRQVAHSHSHWSHHHHWNRTMRRGRGGQTAFDEASVNCTQHNVSMANIAARDAEHAYTSSRLCIIENCGTLEKTCEAKMPAATKAGGRRATWPWMQNNCPDFRDCEADCMAFTAAHRGSSAQSKRMADAMKRWRPTTGQACMDRATEVKEVWEPTITVSQGRAGAFQRGMRGRNSRGGTALQSRTRGGGRDWSSRYHYRIIEAFWRARVQSKATIILKDFIEAIASLCVVPPLLVLNEHISRKKNEQQLLMMALLMMGFILPTVDVLMNAGVVQYGCFMAEKNHLGRSSSAWTALEISYHMTSSFGIWLFTFDFACISAGVGILSLQMYRGAAMNVVPHWHSKLGFAVSAGFAVAFFCTLFRLGDWRDWSKIEGWVLFVLTTFLTPAWLVMLGIGLGETRELGEDSFHQSLSGADMEMDEKDGGF